MFFRNLVGVDVRKSLVSIDILFGLERINKNLVRVEKIGDSGIFGKEFWIIVRIVCGIIVKYFIRVRKDIEMVFGFVVGFENGLYRFVKC